MRPGMPDVVLRRGASSMTLGPAFVSVSDGSGAPRSFPLDGGRGARGAVARLRAQVADGPPGLRPPQMVRLSLVDGRGTPLAALPWDGADHDALEAACAAARLPLDRVPVPGAGPEAGLEAGPDDAPVGDVREVLLRPGAVHPGPDRVAGRLARRWPGGADARAGQVGRPAGGGAGLWLGRSEVAVTGVDGPPLAWPRLGCAEPDEPAVARLRVTLYAEQTIDDPDLLPGPPPTHRLLGLTLLGAAGRPLAYLRWHSRDLSAVRRAAAATGLLLEYRWQPYGDAAELARLGVPVVHAADPADAASHVRPPATPQASRPPRPPRTSRPARPAGPNQRARPSGTHRVSRRPAASGTGRPAGTSGPGGGVPPRLRWWLYGGALLALAVLALAVAVLSA